MMGLGGYALIVVVLLAMEDRLLYVPSDATHWNKPPPGLGVQDVHLRSTDGTPIHAWWLAPKGWRPADGAFLFCHGNGGNLSWRQGAFTGWHREHRFGVLVFDYPGFGKSGGTPSEPCCYAAADAAYDWLTHEQKVAPRRLVVWGGSLGAAVALDLAVRRPCRVLLLEAPFTSFPDIAQERFPWLPARWLVHNRFDNLSKIPRLRVPVFITHDRRDGLIPFAQGQRLFAAAPRPRQLFPTDHDYHNDLPLDEVWPAFGAFLDRYAPAAD
jgi:fermentation-respiration switch protein FrsA (DUF1100 family)